jgi:taurine dioxygenase
MQMSNWIDVGGLTCRPLEPFGIELAVDFSASLGGVQSDGFVRLLWEHGLILARGQTLSMARQRELCSLAGPILIRAGENGYLSTEGASGPSLSELRWHSDAAYTEAPFDLIALHALEVVDNASSTRFIHASHVLNALPLHLRTRLDGREVEMISPSYDAIALRTCDRRDPIAQKRGVRPAIVRNPHTDRECLGISELQCARILGMSWEESRDLLHALYDEIYQPAYVLEHRWCRGDIVFWDNIALQHMRGPLHECGPRLLQRVIVGTQGVAPHVSA